ncbi:MAG: helix-turn-helix domain-containing protein [Thermomicrobiales bacterium]
MRRAAITPPPVYSVTEIKAIRAGVEMSQSEFADALNVSLAAVRQWERGMRVPDGGNARLLQLAQVEPETLRGLTLCDRNPE